MRPQRSSGHQLQVRQRQGGSDETKGSHSKSSPWLAEQGGARLPRRGAGKPARARLRPGETRVVSAASCTGRPLGVSSIPLSSRQAREPQASTRKAGAQATTPEQGRHGKRRGARSAARELRAKLSSTAREAARCHPMVRSSEESDRFRRALPGNASPRRRVEPKVKEPLASAESAR